MSPAIYNVREEPNGRWNVYRDEISIATALHLGHALQQALRLANLDNLRTTFGAKVLLTSRGLSYDLSR